MALINCKQCGHSVSDKSRKCPKCGCLNPSATIEVFKSPSMVDEDKHVKNEDFRQASEVTNVSLFVKKKWVIVLVSIVLFSLTMFVLVRSIGNNADKRLEENRQDLHTSEQVINDEQNSPFKYEIPQKNTEELPQELTETGIEEVFLRHWRHYKGDRELVSIEGCSEGYKVFIGDLNGDGINDAVVNAYVTPSSEEIANNKTENKSYIFCFLNDGERCKLVAATKLYAMFFVDNIVNDEIHAHRIEYMKRVNDGQRTAVRDSHIFKYDGDKLVDLGGTKIVDEENPQIERRSENARLLEGYFYRYEGDMKGFPIKVDFGVLSNGMINGEYQNIKYGTVLDLVGQLISEKSLQLVGENQNEKIVFELSFSSPEHLNGYGKMEGNSLEVKLKLISSEVINDNH